MKRWSAVVIAGVLAVAAAQQGGNPPAQKADGQKAPGQKAGGPPASGGSGVGQTLNLDWPTPPVDTVLGRPTGTGVTVSVRTAQDADVTLVIKGGPSDLRLPPQTLTAGQPQHLPVSGLNPDTAYTLQVLTKTGTDADFTLRQTRTFHTARPAGQAFTFVMQADSHMDANSDLNVYAQTLRNEQAAQPDFVVDLGDTFMTDKYTPFQAAEKQYMTQRTLLGTLAPSPLFLTLGNHDGEGLVAGGKAGQQAMNDWSNAMRLKYFPNPLADGFYSVPKGPGVTPVTNQGAYAWTWGDATFIVLDAYTDSARSGDNNWNATLGRAQYDWLNSTLEGSTSRWKFVFVHQLIGGQGKDGRGGAEAAPFFEWGGKNTDGSAGFAQNRPGWAMPVHDLLVQHHVTAVFHGHDHLYVKQELDGVVYQEVPQPSNARAGNTNSAQEYGYASGTVLGGPGHLRVMVTPQDVKVEYIRTALQDGANAQVGDTYTVK